MASYIFTANKDFLIKEPESLVKELKKNDIEYETKIYGTEENPLYHVFHCDIKTDSAKAANDDETEFFKKYIK